MKNLASKLESIVLPLDGTEGREGSRCRNIRLYRSPWSLLPGVCTFLMLTVVIMALSMALGNEIGTRQFVRLAAMVPLLYLLNLVRLYFDELYVFKSNVLCHHTGRLSLHYEMPVIYYSDVREITVDQGLLGRIFNFGDVAVGTAATSHRPMIFKGVDDPKLIQQFIDRLRRIRQV